MWKASALGGLERSSLDSVSSAYIKEGSCCVVALQFAVVRFLVLLSRSDRGKAVAYSEA